MKATSDSWFKLRVTYGTAEYQISEARYMLTRWSWIYDKVTS